MENTGNKMFYISGPDIKGFYVTCPWAGSYEDWPAQTSILPAQRNTFFDP